MSKLSSTAVNYVPTDILNYHGVFEKRFGIKYNIPTYQTNTFISHYDTNTMVNHVFDLASFQVQEAERLNLPKPQC